jgi:integrase
MYSKDKPGKANKGSVQVKSSNSRLQLVFSFGGKRHYLSTGYPDTPQYRKLAQMKATEIEKDILYERFDETLAKYKPKSALSTVTPITPIATPAITLAEIWTKYVEWKRPQCAPSTMKNQYREVNPWIRTADPRI